MGKLADFFPGQLMKNIASQIEAKPFFLEHRRYAIFLEY
jgi:hypothetical protein